jgi:hypothetical protein
LRPGFVDPCARRGPLTAAGKARSSQNARRHGLSLPVFHDPGAMAEVEALAQKICRSCGGAQAERNPGPQSACAQAENASERLRLARRIAEAQIDLERVRRARHDVIARAFADPYYRPAKGLHAWIRLLAKAGDLLVQGIALPQDMRDAILIKPQGVEKLALILREEAGRLAKLDRYERRVLSRRKFAIRAFDDAEVERARRRGPILAERNTPKITHPINGLHGPSASLAQREQSNRIWHGASAPSPLVGEGRRKAVEVQMRLPAHRETGTARSAAEARASEHIRHHSHGSHQPLYRADALIPRRHSASGPRRPIAFTTVVPDIAKSPPRAARGPPSRCGGG